MARLQLSETKAQASVPPPQRELRNSWDRSPMERQSSSPSVVTQLKDKIAKLQASEEQAQLQIGQLEKELLLLRAKQEENSIKLLQAHSERVALRETLKCKEEEVKAAHLAVTQQRRAHEELVRAERKSKRSSCDADVRCSLLEDELGKRNAELARQEERLFHAEADTARLGAQLDGLKGEVAELQLRISDLRHANSMLEATNKDASHAIEELQGLCVLAAF